MDNTQNQQFMTQRVSERCKRCGRKLKNPASMELGFGIICYKKFMSESLLRPLFKTGSTIKEPSKE